MPLFRFVAADDFEVVESPIATTPYKKVEAAEGVPVETADAATGTEPAVPAVPCEAEGQIGEVRRQIDSLTKKTGDRAVAHDRRVRTLEYCFDDCEAEIQRISKAMGHVKEQIGGSAAKQEALDALRLSVDEAAMIARDNSTRLDRVVVRYLPSIEAKIQVVKLDQERWHVQTEASLRDLSGMLNGANPSGLTHIRRIAGEADLRVRSVERRLSELRTELLLAMAVEAASAQESAENDRAEAARMVDRLTKEHSDMWQGSRELSLRVKRTEDVVQQLAGTVVPVLEHRIQQQSLLLCCKEAEIKGAANGAELREALLAARVQRLEEKLGQDAGLRLRLDALEKAVGILSAAPANVPPPPPMADGTGRAKRTLSHRIKAEILRRAIRAELFNRGTRRQRTVVERLSARTLRAGALRIAIGAEVRRRNRRRGTPSSASLRAACVGREIRLEIARRQEAQHRRSGPLLAAVRAACILRELRVEIARRHDARHRTGPFAAALRAACIRREINVEIARRQDALRPRRRVLSAAALRAYCLRRELRVEITKRREARHRTGPFAAALRAACIRREINVEIARRQDAVRRRCAPSAAALRAGCLRREIRVEITKRREARHRTGPFAAALRAACIRRELRAEITRRQQLACRLNAPSAAALRAGCIRLGLRAEITRRREASRPTRAEVVHRAVAAAFARQNAVRPAAAAAAECAAADDKTAEITVRCRTLTGEVAVNVRVPTFVSVRYLKQLIYFKGNCPVRPSAMNLVYAGRVLEDGWKVGGGLFTAPRPALSGRELDEFTGIQSEGTVMIIEKAV